MNFSTLNDSELQNYRKRLLDSHIEILRDKGLSTALMFFYGIFAFVGIMLWCVEEALHYQTLPVKLLNYFLIITGAVSLYVAHKKDKNKLINKSLIDDELNKVNEEIYRRNISKD